MWSRAHEVLMKLVYVYGLFRVYTETDPRASFARAIIILHFRSELRCHSWPLAERSRYASAPPAPSCTVRSKYGSQEKVFSLPQTGKNVGMFLQSCTPVARRIEATADQLVYQLCSSALDYIGIS